MIQFDIVAIAFVAMMDFLYLCGQHSIDSRIAASEVDAIMEPLTSDDGVGAIAILGAHFQKVKG
jgi:hypothetical protein